MELPSSFNQNGPLEMERAEHMDKRFLELNREIKVKVQRDARAFEAICRKLERQRMDEEKRHRKTQETLR